MSPRSRPNTKIPRYPLIQCKALHYKTERVVRAGCGPVHLINFLITQYSYMWQENSGPLTTMGWTWFLPPLVGISIINFVQYAKYYQFKVIFSFRNGWQLYIAVITSRLSMSLVRQDGMHVSLVFCLGSKSEMILKMNKGHDARCCQ